MTGISANLDRTSVSLAPGEEEAVTIRVRNTSDIVEAYHFDVVGEVAEWATVEPSRLSLYPDTEGAATLRLRPPRSPRVLAGEVPFGVRVLPAENPGGSAVPEGTVNVLPYRQLAGELVPRVSRGRLRGRARVSVQNQSNVPAAVAVAAGDAGGQLRFRQRPVTVYAEPGQTSYADLRMRPRRLLWRGAPHEHAVGVRLTPEDSAPSTLDGTFVQLPLVPGWLLKVLAALLALLALLAGLWFGLLRPAVRTAAREAADETAGQAAQEAVAKQAAAGPGAAAQRAGGTGAPDTAGGGAGSGSGGAAGAGAGSGGGTAAAGGDHFSTTLALRTRPGGSAVKSFTVPAGKVFSLTDFVAENPQGDEGVLTVTAQNAQIIVIALENFRDQDYHWVTPIRVPGKGQIRLAVTCRKTGTPAGAGARRTCAESLYLNGTLGSDRR